MMKKEACVPDDHKARGLRRSGLLFLMLSLVMIIALICVNLAYRNPWLVHSIEAEQVNEAVFEQVADSTSPYLKITGMKLSFTGYYTVDTDEKVRSYCYMGLVGDEYILVNVEAEDGGALALDSNAANATLQDYIVTGQVMKSTEIASHLASSEEMTVDEYRSFYAISDYEIHGYDSDCEKVRIIQLMGLILALGCLAIGGILFSEAGLREADDETDKDINEE